MIPRLSIIIPTFNEMKNGYLEKILQSLSNLKDIEVICVDSYSEDGTKELIEKYQYKLISYQTTSRGERLSIGAKEAKSEMIFLHHPRTLYDNRGLEYLKDRGKELSWGGFSHEFDYNHPLLRFTSWYSNKIRADKKSIFYLDHGVFVKKSLLEKINYIPSVDIFEDTYLSLNLRSISTGHRLRFKAITSAIRFKNYGFFKQILLNQYMKFLFYFKFEHKKLNKIYERENKLNSIYKGDEEDV